MTARRKQFVAGFLRRCRRGGVGEAVVVALRQAPAAPGSRSAAGESRGRHVLAAAAPVTLEIKLPTSAGSGSSSAGTYDSPSGAVSGVEPYAAIWNRRRKTLAASATAGGTPSSAQVSSEANVGDPSP